MSTPDTPPKPSDSEQGAGAFSDRERRIIAFCMSQMQDLSDADWRDHGYRASTFRAATCKLYALLNQGHTIPKGD